MLNMCILVKPVMDPDSIKWDYQNQQFSFESNTFNAADLQALQWACEYKEKNGGTITVLLAADTNMVIDQKRLLKYNFDKCVIIQQPELRKHRGETARLLADELKKYSFDVIMCGSFSDDENLGVTPAMVAELLYLSCLTNIHQIDVDSERTWKVKRSEERGIVQTYEVELPLLIGVVNTLGRKRYIPRYSRSYQTKKKIEVQELGVPIEESNTRVVKISEPKPNIRYFDIPEDSLSPALRLLKIMGLAQEQKQQSGEKIASNVNEQNIHFISQKLQKWLMEG
jgi:electron transfer flavoprotein alpha/beta subunit